MILPIRNRVKWNLLLIWAIGLFIAHSIQGQDKISARVTLEYVKVMQEHSFLNISAIHRGEEGFEPCQNLNFIIYKVIREVEDVEERSEIKIGKATTNENGNARFILPSKDISAVNEYIIKIEDNDIYEDEEESVEITDAFLEASMEVMDSINYVKAKLFLGTDEPLAEQELYVGLKRLFGSMPVGEDEAYQTDENGEILVPINEKFPGVDGKLTFEVSLADSDAYGTVIAPIISDIGEPIVDESTFDQRTMWSPPSRTPLFLWIVPNLILIGIWSVLVLLVINLYKIFKS